MAYLWNPHRTITYRWYVQLWQAIWFVPLYLIFAFLVLIILIGFGRQAATDIMRALDF